MKWATKVVPKTVSFRETWIGRITTTAGFAFGRMSLSPAVLLFYCLCLYLLRAFTHAAALRATLLCQYLMHIA